MSEYQMSFGLPPTRLAKALRVETSMWKTKSSPEKKQPTLKSIVKKTRKNKQKEESTQHQEEKVT